MIIHQLDSFNVDAVDREVFLKSAQNILLETIVKERMDFSTRTITETERNYKWWVMEGDRLARPNPIPLTYVNNKDYVDYETFTIDEEGHYLFYDFIFTSSDITVPVFDFDDTESVLVDMLASAMYAVTELEDYHVAYAYMSFMYSISSLIKLTQSQKTNFRQVTDAVMAAQQL